MRRSRRIRLTLLAASAMALQACGGEDVDGTDVVVSDVAACVQRFGADAEAECRQAFTDGRAAHVDRLAPRFGDVAACREATGSECETTPANRPTDKFLATGALTSVAIPVMAGLLISGMLADGSGRVVAPLHAGRPPPNCPPGQPPTQDCVTPASSSSGGSSSTSSSGSGARHYYSGRSYAGSAPARAGAATFTPSPAMARTIANGPTAARQVGTVSRGGFGASARGYSSSS